MNEKKEKNYREGADDEVRAGYQNDKEGDIVEDVVAVEA